MKKLLVFIFLLIGLNSFSQDNIFKIGYTPIYKFIPKTRDYFPPANYVLINQRYRWVAGMFDSTFHIPIGGGTPSVRTGGWSHSGGLWMDTVNNYLYFLSSGSWRYSLKSSDSSVALTTSYTTNKRLQKIIDSLNSIGLVYTANLPIRITSKVISADTSVAFTPSLTTNARLKKIIDSLDAAGWDANGTVTSFTFTDGNGFDGTVTSPTTTPILSLTTTVPNTQLIYSSSGGVAGVTGVTSDGTNITALSGALRASSPRITTSINDANGNESIRISSTTSAANDITVVNAATSANPSITASGDDANVGIDFNFKGTGVLNFKGNATQAAEIRFFEDTDDGTNYTSIKTAALASNVAYTLPTTDGNSGEFLQTDGTGVLTWATGGGGSSTWNGITNPTGDQALTFDAGESSTWNSSNTIEDLMTWNSSTMTTSSMLSMAITGTAQATGSRGLKILRSGANASNGQIIIGAEFGVTNTNATSGTNVAAYFNASGATTANYAIEVAAGQTILPAGTSSLPTIKIGAAGLYEFGGGTGVGFYVNNFARAVIGDFGLLIRDGGSAVIDFGRSGTLGGTNYWRMSAPAVGTMQLGMETNQQAMIFKGANNSGTNAAAFSMTIQSGAGTGNATTGGEIFLSTSDATGSGTTVQSYTPKLTITKDGRVYGSALHNNAGDITGTTNQYIASGTYTPTLTGVTNVTGTTAYQSRYTRVGNVVTVSGFFDVTPTSTSTFTGVGISLPITSALTQSYHLSGTTNVGFGTTSHHSGILAADVTNDRANIDFFSVTAGGNQRVYFSFQYEVL